MPSLIAEDQLPPGFEYPREFLRIVELGLTNLEPWWVIEGDLLLERYRDLAKRYPAHTFVPFAIRVDCDDVACWDVGGGVVIVHDFASEGREVRARYRDTYQWLKQAIEDLIEYEN
jgi:hypothetical protein